ncbi:hypothetical protein NFO65_08190 [Neorhizobium galegae]|nr:hypothetical protein [Neorhizobium galegae]MCQ1570716.1 hypothetical protein [Neorhizobium galegae]
MEHQVAPHEIRCVCKAIRPEFVGGVEEQQGRRKRAGREYIELGNDCQLVSIPPARQLGDRLVVRRDLFHVALIDDHGVSGRECRLDERPPRILLAGFMADEAAALAAPVDISAGRVNPIGMHPIRLRRVEKMLVALCHGRRLDDLRSWLQRILAAAHMQEALRLAIKRLKVFIVYRPGLPAGLVDDFEIAWGKPFERCRIDKRRTADTAAERGKEPDGTGIHRAGNLLRPPAISQALRFVQTIRVIPFVLRKVSQTLFNEKYAVPGGCQCVSHCRPAHSGADDGNVPFKFHPHPQLETRAVAIKPSAGEAPSDAEPSIHPLPMSIFSAETVAPPYHLKYKINSHAQF